MTTFHPRLGCAKITTIKCNEIVPRGWNRQIIDTTIEEYICVPFHVGGVKIIPQFCARYKNVMYETTNEIANQNKLLHANEERYPILVANCRVLAVLVEKISLTTYCIYRTHCGYTKYFFTHHQNNTN